MDTILLLIVLIVLLIPVLWFSTEKIQSIRKPIENPEEYWGVVAKPHADNNTIVPQVDEHQKASNLLKGGSGRLYYSVPGRSFFAYINNGRVIRKR